MGGSESGRATPRSTDIEQAIIELKKGAHLLKYGRKRKPKLCYFRLSMDERYLMWFSGNEEKNVKISSITKIIRGQVNFQQQARTENSYLSFSLIYRNGEKSLNLICKDKEQAKYWYLGLKTLISASDHSKISNLRKDGGTHSYSNSPVSYSRKKNISELLERSLKHSQDLGRPLKVHSLCGSPSLTSGEKCFSDGLQLSPKIWPLLEDTSLSTKGSINDYNLPSHLVESGYHAEETTEDTKSEGCHISFSGAISSTTNGYPLDDKDTLVDVFLWGEGIGGSVLAGGNDGVRSFGFQADLLLPKLLESATTLDIASISCGRKHMSLVTKTGKVFCWGEENGGRLGHRINIDVSVPKFVELLSDINIQSVECGELHTCALSHSGEVYMWGGWGHGFNSLAYVSRKNFRLPQKIPLEGIHISTAACGDFHTALVSSSGQLFTFGEGTFGALGHGDLESSLQPREVESLKGLKVKAVACGPWHTAAIVEIPNEHSIVNHNGGKLFTWGDGDKGKLGHSDKERKLFPTFVASLAKTDFQQVSCGQTMTVALTVSGTVFTMGSSVHGQLGNPHARTGEIAVVEGALKCEPVKEISSGSYHVAVLTSEGNLYTWGKGASGRLGLGDVDDRNSPSLVEGLRGRDVRTVTCGSSFTAVVCRHRTLSKADQSSCSQCRKGFGFTRKKHHCYNCGLTFCHTCSSKKSMNACLAPNKSKYYRVCDRCFAQLRNGVNIAASQETPRSRQRSLMNKLSISSLKIHKPEAASTMLQITSPRLCNHEDLKHFERKNMREGADLHPRNPVPSISFEPQHWGQVECPKSFDVFKAISTFSVSYAAKETVAASASHENALKSRFPRPANTAVHEFEDAKTRKYNGQLIEEMQRLRIEVKNLEEQCKVKDEKFEQYKKEIEEVWSFASEEVTKSRAAKDVIKVLAARLKEISEKFATEKELVISKRILAHEKPMEVEESRSLEDNLRLASLSDHMSDRRSRSPNGPPTSSCGKHVHGDHQKPENIGKTSNPEEARPAFSEWVEQIEPGVYITFMALPDGRRDLKRVRFSRKRFSGKEAETWWAENQSRVHHKYNVVGSVNT